MIPRDSASSYDISVTASAAASNLRMLHLISESREARQILLPHFCSRDFSTRADPFILQLCEPESTADIFVPYGGL